MEGAAPSTTTKRMADSLNWKRVMARGNQAMEGIDWSPVIIEPMATRSSRTRLTARPTAAPTTMARA